MMQYILKGDTSGQIALALADGFDYSTATVSVVYQGAVRQFKNCAAGQTIQFSLTAAETAPMAIGAFPVTVRISKPDGTLITVANAGVKIAVTDCIGEVRAGSVIAVDAHGGLYGVDDLPANYTIKDLRTKINEIITKLGGGIAALCVALTCACASAASVNLQTAALEDISNGAQVVTNATLDTSGLTTAPQLATATNATLTAANAYTDTAVQQAVGMTPAAVTNIANYRIDAKVAPWAMADQPQPTTDLSGMTNYVNSTASTAYQNATNAAAASAAAKYKSISWLPYWYDVLNKPNWIGSSKPTYTAAEVGARSSTWVPSWGQVTSKPSWIGSEKPTYTATDVGALSTSDGGTVMGDVAIDGSIREEYCGSELIYRSNALQFGPYATDGGYEFYMNDDMGLFIRWYGFDEGLGEEFWKASQLIPDGTPFMTAGTADFLLTNAVDYSEYMELRSGVMYNIYFETPTVPIFTINFGNDLMRGCDIMLRIVNDQDIVFEIESDNVIIDGNEWTGEISAGTNLLMITKTAFLPDEGTDGKSVIMLTNKEIK